MSFIDKLAWVAQDAEGRFLLVRSHGKELFYLPGGKREAGEGDLEALARELKEELGVDLDRAQAQAAGVFEGPADGKPGVTVRLTCYRGPASGTPAPAAEIAELAWLGLSDAPRLSPAALLVVRALS